MYARSAEEDSRTGSRPEIVILKSDKNRVSL
jgi:hypothetical protein